jgi:UDP-3-O-[3-hydroxymyristoyl] glucosamine N-acyltransferase
MSNPYRRLIALIPGQPEDAGEVIATDAAGCTVQLPTGALVRVRGSATIGDHVYIRAGAIIGPAPALTGGDQEV